MPLETSESNLLEINGIDYFQRDTLTWLGSSSEDCVRDPGLRDDGQQSVDDNPFSGVYGRFLTSSIENNSGCAKMAVLGRQPFSLQYFLEIWTFLIDAFCRIHSFLILCPGGLSISTGILGFRNGIRVPRRRLGGWLARKRPGPRPESTVDGIKSALVQTQRLLSLGNRLKWRSLY